MSAPSRANFGAAPTCVPASQPRRRQQGTWPRESPWLPPSPRPGAGGSPRLRCPVRRHPPVHRELERTGCAAHRRVPRTWRWGQVRDERVGQGAPASQTGSRCLRLLVRTGMGVDRGDVAGGSHRRHAKTPCPQMLLVEHGNALSQSTPVRRDGRRRARVVLSLYVRMLEKVSFAVSQKNNDYVHP